MKNLVIVESPAKAKKIAEYLWKDYQVEASIWHIRDLPEKNMWVDIAAWFIPEYEVTADKKKRVGELKKYAQWAEKIILATDPDREWEAIAWHLAHVFNIDPVKAERVTYNEITKTAIQESFSHPRTIDINLVNAQQSRRILDRIVGYEVSPVLWKKIRPGLSAGRVQSVAVKLLVEREREIRAFIPEESWKIEANIEALGYKFPIEFTKVDGKNKKYRSETDIEKFFSTYGIQIAWLQRKKDKKGNILIEVPLTHEFALSDVEKKESTRMPGAPFTTSTLQQEASRKLGYGVKQTMDIAQRLYQSGHITYMRTDSVNLSDLAIGAAREFITKTYGSEYTMPNGRKYKTKQASAQEAHEAIRPTYMDKTPENIDLDGQELRIYTLIWQRTVASQMKEAIVETTTFSFTPASHASETWIAKGEVIQFPGFMKLYIEGTDDEEEEDSQKLPPLKKWDTVESYSFVWGQKFSLPPPRYTEASLVKKLESEWIGRPSTYAPTIQTIQDRGYVEKEEKKLVPTDIAFVVTDYLDKEFASFMQYSFTAEVEAQFDEVSEGKLEWQKMLGNFYTPFHTLIEWALWAEGRFAWERILGKDPVSGRSVLVRMSRFGPVVQIGATGELAEDEKPKYANLPQGSNMDTIEFEAAMKSFALPKILGSHEWNEVTIGSGRYGPYVKYGEAFTSIPRGEDALSIDMERALQIIAEKATAEAPIAHYDGKPVSKGKGRFGPFLKWNGLYVNIPKNIDFDTITENECEKLIALKVEKEATRYIHNWPEQKISVENGRYGPFIKWEKKNLYLKRGSKKITEMEEIKALDLEDIKTMIDEQVPGAFSEKKKTWTKKSPVKKATAKKSSAKKKA
jgi:DNA topoisomerase I